MTTPDLSGLIPSKWKTWVALAGSALSFGVPYVLSAEQYLPSPWPAVIGVVLFILSTLGVYKAPYVPPGAVVVPEAVAKSLPPAAGEFKNPWQR